MGKREVLYLNGLGRGKDRTREGVVFRHLEKHSVHVTHAHIDWYSGESFDVLFRRILELAGARLREEGSLTVVGTSAGGSLALNVFGHFKDERVDAVSICGCVREEGNLPFWDHRSLEHRAFRGGRNLTNLYDSVKYCEDVTTPSLSEEEKGRIRITKPILDFVVPRTTMDIKGVKTSTLPVIGHNAGIMAGLWNLPKELPVASRTTAATAGQ